MTELHELTIADAREMLASGEISALELTQACLDRIVAVDNQVRAFLAIDAKALAAALIVFAIVLLATRIVSLASILSAASIPIFLRFLTHAPFWTVVLSIVISIAIILKHHSNIARLAQGSERKMGGPK